MNAFLEAAFTMPTTIFSGMLILVAFYWLTFLFGLFDLEILEGLFDGFGGAAESLDGAADSIGGAVDAVGGAAESVGGAADAVGGAVDTAGGAAEGMVHGSAEGLTQSADAVGDHGGCLGLGGVPTIITATAFTIFGWLVSYFGSAFVSSLDLTTSAVGMVPWAVGFGSIAGSAVITSISLRPLKKVFRLPPVTANTDLVGKVCTVTTLRVDARFGQAEVIDEDGTPILIQARSREVNTLGRGHKALIFDYDPTSQVFFVAPPRSDADISSADATAEDL